MQGKGIQKVKKKLEFIDIPGQKFPYEIANIIDELMSKTSIYLTVDSTPPDERLGGKWFNFYIDLIL